MPGVWVYDELLILMNKKSVEISALELRLFKNNHTPGPTDSIGDYTEADFDGYSPQSLTEMLNAAFLNGSNAAQLTSNLHTWFMTGSTTPNTIYGYFLTRPGGVLAGAERSASGGFLMDSSGKTYSVFVVDVMT